ncbi:MAG: hypothetical protein ACOZAA_08275 [Pseudomonadota bacterium]
MVGIGGEAFFAAFFLDAAFFSAFFDDLAILVLLLGRRDIMRLRPTFPSAPPARRIGRSHHNYRKRRCEVQIRRPRQNVVPARVAVQKFALNPRRDEPTPGPHRWALRVGRPADLRQLISER